MYGIEVRRLVLNLIEEQHKSASEIAEFLKISERSVARWKALAKKDDLTPKTSLQRKKKLDPEAIRSYVEQNPDHILATMAQHFNVGVSAIWYRLKCMKITLKKRPHYTKSEMKISVKSL